MAVVTVPIGRERVAMTRHDSPAAAAQVGPTFDVEHCIQSSVISGYRAAFQSATGMSIEVVPPVVDMPGQLGGNLCCRFGCGAWSGCARCWETHERLRWKSEVERRPFQLSCSAGLTHVAAPVISGGRLVALLWSVDVHSRPPALRKVAGDAAPHWSNNAPARTHEARNAHLFLPTGASGRLALAIQLIGELSKLLAAEGERSAAISIAAEPAAVANAKRFIHAHIGMPIAPRDVVRHLGLNQSYFCRLFKKTTRLSLSEYIRRLRLEIARERLVYSSLMVTAVAELAGFTSIPHFNRVFKRQFKMSPTQYRKTQLPSSK